MLITGDNEYEIENTIISLKQEFSIREMGYPEKFLGFEITKCKNENIFIHQTKYIEEKLKQFRMDESIAKSTPMIPFTNHKINVNDDEDRTFPYRSAIGELLYG